MFLCREGVLPTQWRMTATSQAIRFLVGLLVIETEAADDALARRTQAT